MRDRIERMLLYAFSAAAVIAGILMLSGYVHLESRFWTLVVGLGAVLNGLLLIRTVRRIQPGQPIKDR